MGLNEQERATLAALQKKANEPDAPPVGKSVSIRVDLGDAEQVKRAQRYGFLPADEEETSPEGEGEEEGGTDVGPKRSSYFGS